jgi:hypothetical protein
MDRQLHRDRLAGPRTKRTYRADIATLPDGAYIVVDKKAWLVWDSAIFAWSAGGYTDRQERPSHSDVEVLTPRSTVTVMSAGYQVTAHPSASR